MFHILDHFRTKQISKPLEKFTDWERFQSLASNLILRRVNINSGVEADKAEWAFTASVASAYRLSTSKISLSELNKDMPVLDRLLKYGVAHTHGNVRVDPERPVAVLDRRKSAVVSVDAISRTRTECSRWPWEVCRCPGQKKSAVVSVDAVSRTRTECSRWPCEIQSWLRTDWRARRNTSALNVCVGLVRSSRGFGEIEELDLIHAHAHWMFALALKRH
jgi:hypothetical protein